MSEKNTPLTESLKLEVEKLWDEINECTLEIEKLKFRIAQLQKRKKRLFQMLNQLELLLGGDLHSRTT